MYLVYESEYIKVTTPWHGMYSLAGDAQRSIQSWTPTHEPDGAGETNVNGKLAASKDVVHEGDGMVQYVREDVHQTADMNFFSFVKYEQNKLV